MIPMNTNLRPVHPGEVLSEEFLKPLKLSQNRLALEIGVDARRVNEIVLGRRKISAEAALRLARYFGNSPQFWLGLQTEYDLDVAADSLGDRLEREIQPRDIDNVFLQRLIGIPECALQSLQTYMASCPLWMPSLKIFPTNKSTAFLLQAI
jgi:antitoxin HigA-1